MKSWSSRLGNSGWEGRGSWDCWRRVTRWWGGGATRGRIESLKFPVCGSSCTFGTERSSRTGRGIEIQQSKAVCDRGSCRVMTRDAWPSGSAFEAILLLLLLLLLLNVFLNFKCQSKFVDFYSKLCVFGMIFHFCCCCCCCCCSFQHEEIRASDQYDGHSQSEFRLRWESSILESCNNIDVVRWHTRTCTHPLAHALAVVRAHRVEPDARHCLARGGVGVVWRKTGVRTKDCAIIVRWDQGGGGGKREKN